jgi:hypothetical protein
MNKKEIIIIALGVILLTMLFIVFALQITIFSNSLTSENLTFTGNENITRNLSIYRYANITSAYINLSNYNSTRSYNGCYQESADVSNQTGIDGNCNLIYTGSYSFVTGSSTIMFINYTKPNKYLNASWVVSQIYGTKTNYTIINSCLELSHLSLYINATPVPGNFNLKGYCLNSSGWQQLFSTSSEALTSEGVDLANADKTHDGSWTTGTHWSTTRSAWQDNSDPGVAGIYEEAINWNIFAYPTNPSISINNTQIWNYSGVFNQTNNKTNDFVSTLNTAINNGSCDCQNCSIIGTNCSIPFIFHSDTLGVIGYSDININWLEYNKPNLTINKPKIEYSTTEIPYNISISDDYQLSSCIYWVMRGASLEIANTSISCLNSTGNLYVSSQNTNYTFHIFVNDTSGNYNYSNSSFSTSLDAIIITPPGSPGGGGGSIIEKLTEKVTTPFCNLKKPAFDKAWEDFFSSYSWKNFKTLWFAFWDNGLCESSASIIPLRYHDQTLK